MARTQKNGRMAEQLEFELPSTRDAIQEALREAYQAFPGVTPHFFVVLRELLTNAVVHGNRLIPDRTVFCAVYRLSPESYEILVRDQGNGFDFLQVNTSLPGNPQHLQKRGYVLINALTELLTFNEKGNEVSVIFNASSAGLPEYAGSEEKDDAVTGSPISGRYPTAGFNQEKET
jgi:serine/threonine-protein kinase RsbW